MKQIPNLPPGSWDTHCHVFDPETHPYVPNSPYAPPKRDVNDLTEAISVTNFVVVMTVPDGTNTGAMLDAISHLESKGRRGRGTVVMDIDQMSPHSLSRLHRAGIRSVRIHALRVGEKAGALEIYMEETAKKIAQAGVPWLIDAQLKLDTWSRLSPTLDRLYITYGTRFVADHMLCSNPTDIHSSSLVAPLRLLDRGVLVIKISGLERYQGNQGFTAFEPLIRKFLACREGRGVIFGSDWPHVVMGPGGELSDVNIGEHLHFIKAVCDDVGNGLWEKLMRDNADELFT